MENQTNAQQLKIKYLKAARLWHDNILALVNSVAGFSGAHQGTDETYEILATSDAQSLESFEKDSAELIIYFENLISAKKAESILAASPYPLEITCEEIEPQDWNARWKKEFEGIDLPPYWRILPPWKSDENKSDLKTIIINPAMGFGTGTHETTQLCLESIGSFENLDQKNILDFGSGSGILAAAAAMKGGKVWAVEIDEQACESAKETFEINKVSSGVTLVQSLSDLQKKSFDIIIANIISSVLEKYVRDLVALSHSETMIILSGILEEQVASVKEIYENEFFLRHNKKIKASASNLKDWWRITLK